jgi:hypothetical protein
MNWIQNMNRCTGPANWDYGKTPDWVPLTEREPVDGQMVEVMADAWTVPKWLKFDAAAKRLRDVSTGMHFWYPERMKWRPLETPNDLSSADPNEMLGLVDEQDERRK